MKWNKDVVTGIVKWTVLRHIAHFLDLWIINIGHAFAIYVLHIMTDICMGAESTFRDPDSIRSRTCRRWGECLCW